jgi:hypothetical protein
MMLARRAPHPTFGSPYEECTFKCIECDHEMDRAVDPRAIPAPEDNSDT